MLSVYYTLYYKTFLREEKNLIYGVYWLVIGLLKQNSTVLYMQTFTSNVQTHANFKLQAD